VVEAINDCGVGVAGDGPFEHLLQRRCPEENGKEQRDAREHVSREILKVPADFPDRLAIAP
jgi:hypothetical protein